MQKFKSTLLAATIVAGFAANPVAAQTFTPGPYAIVQPGLPATTVTPTGGTPVAYEGDSALHIAGATSVQNILVRVFNCLGQPYKLGKSGAGGSAAALSAITPITYAGVTGSAANVALTCNNSDANNVSAYNATYSGTAGATYEVQPQGTDAAGAKWGFAAKYVATGSGFGRNAWKYFTDLFDSSPATLPSGASVATGVFNPFQSIGTDSRWSHLQAAFSDTPLAQSELATYNTNAAPHAGPAIQFPLFVLPVAIAYNTTYATDASGNPLSFNTQFSATVNGTSVKTIRLTTEVYCGIFNGKITNWNDAKLTALNKKTSLGAPTDTLFTKLGAPIRLVGRMDGSGTTNVFTRHLSTVCSNSKLYSGSATNKYAKASDYLPYDPTTNGNADFSTIRTDTKYKPTGSGFAGTSNTVSGDYYKAGAIVNLNPGTTPSATPASGYTGTGLFILANGGGDLAKTLALAPDYSGGGTGDTRKLNGKLGYISADFVQPSKVDAPGTVVAASLGYTGAPFVYPSYSQALKAFTNGGNPILPPETDSTGAYTPGTDTRQVNVSTTATGNATRANPTAWTDVLYVADTNGNSLAYPASGYAITGTTQFFGYTCYATAGNREAIAELLGTLLGQIKKDASTPPKAFATGSFNNISPAATGIVDQSNIAVVPKLWQTAIANTFLTNSASTTDTSGTLNLWIQDAVVPTVAKKTTKGVVSYTVTRPNANTTACASVASGDGA